MGKRVYRSDLTMFMGKRVYRSLWFESVYLQRVSNVKKNFKCQMSEKSVKSVREQQLRAVQLAIPIMGIFVFHSRDGLRLQFEFILATV